MGQTKVKTLYQMNLKELREQLAFWSARKDAYMVSRIENEIAHLEKTGDKKPDTLAPAVALYSLGGDVFTTKRPNCGECGSPLRADETCTFCQ